VAVAAGLWAAVVIGRMFAARRPDAVETLYARRVFPGLARALSTATGWIPFSLAEMIVLAGILAVLLWAGHVVVRGRWRRWTGPGVVTGAARVVAFVGLAVALFDLLWGYNYDRAPVAALLGYEVAPAPAADLAALSADLLAEAAALREGLPEDGAGVLKLPDGRRGAAGRAARGYAAPELAGRLPVPSLSAPPKLVLLSPLMSYLGIGGIFIPFTCEANVNATLPDWEIPFTSAHELAHQRGFAREEEANYVGYLACRAHPDRDFRYSGTFRAALYAMGALARADRESYGRLRGRLSPALQRDLVALAAWHRRYESRLGEVQERVNDAYLKTQGQADGVQSYGRMVDLLLAERRRGAR
jgi:hypothetical protein